MKNKIIAGGFLALGLSIFAPTAVEAARPVEHRTEVHAVKPVERHDRVVNEHVAVRDEHVVVDRDRFHARDGFIPAPVVREAVVPVAAPEICGPIALGQVPAFIIDAANRQSGGAPILGVDYVNIAGGHFYDVRVQTAGGLQTMRFGIYGGFRGCV